MGRPGGVPGAGPTGGFGTPRGPPPSLCAGPVASRWALHRAAPALKVTFTVAPGCGPGFACGVSGRAAAAGTRAPDRGDTCAHTRFRGAQPPQTDRISSPTPSAPELGEPSGLGSLWHLRGILPQGCPQRQDPGRSLCAGCSPESEAQLEASQAWSLGRARGGGVCVVKGLLWFIPRGKAITPRLQAVISALLDVGLVG